MKRFNVSGKTFLIIILLLVLAGGFYPGHSIAGGAIGMILSAEGTAREISSSSPRKVYPLDPVLEGSVLSTGRDGSITYVDYSNGNEYHLAPSTTVSFVDGRAKVTAGNLRIVSGKAGLPLPEKTTIASRRIIGEFTRGLKTPMPVPPPEIEPAPEPAPAPAPRIFVAFNSPQPNSSVYRLKVPVKWAGPQGENFALSLYRLEDEEDVLLEPFPVEVENSGTYVLENTGEYPCTLCFGREYRVTLTDSLGKNHSVVFNTLPGDEARGLMKIEGIYRDMIQEDPKNARAHMLMATLFYERGLYTDALGPLKSLQELDPDNPRIYYFLGSVYERLGQTITGQGYMEQGNKLMREQSPASDAGTNENLDENSHQEEEK